MIATQVSMRVAKGMLATLLTASLVVGSTLTALADESEDSTVLDPFWVTPSAVESNDQNLLKTYGVRAGSAGPDFLGITNTNFDFTGGSASSDEQYTGYLDNKGHDIEYTVTGAGLGIWATSVNDYPNPYYQNLFYNAVIGQTTGQTYTQATTWMSNPSTSSWGDSNNSKSHVGNVSTGAETIAGLEFSPDIIFGANKYVNWDLASDGSNSGTNMYAKISTMTGYDPEFVNNDATNIWTQIYTMGQLAETADTITRSSTSKTTRYNDSDATQSAVDYERATKGQMLYIASLIDSDLLDKKTVAYLYAVDSTGKGYFFVPNADDLLFGDDTGVGLVESSAATADDNYAANNSTINMGYMATLPFITETFDSGEEFYDYINDKPGIVMCVEDIYKVNPACVVYDEDTDALEGVDVIIGNSTLLSNLDGTSGGRNSSGVNNGYIATGDTLEKWAREHGFKGTFINGDDFGTSTNQGYGTSDAKEDMAPLLYCQRNYTVDKNARAAWAFAKVYPELYGNNDDATYGYWVDKVYHIKTESVATVVAYMTNQSSVVVYDQSVANSVEAKADAGYEWWVTTGCEDPDWSDFSYYNGSSRASYYSGLWTSEEEWDTIGIFEPSEFWTAVISAKSESE